MRSTQKPSVTAGLCAPERRPTVSRRSEPRATTSRPVSSSGRNGQAGKRRAGAECQGDRDSDRARAARTHSLRPQNAPAAPERSTRPDRTKLARSLAVGGSLAKEHFARGGSPERQDRRCRWSDPALRTRSRPVATVDRVVEQVVASPRRPDTTGGATSRAGSATAACPDRGA